MKYVIDFKNNADAAKYFRDANDCTYMLNAEGLVLTATECSRDPYVFVDIVSLLGPEIKNFCTADRLGAINAKIKTNHPGFFEIYYIVGSVKEPTANCNAGEHYRSAFQNETVSCVFCGRPEYKGELHDGFRIDWSNYCRRGDSMTIESITLFSSGEEAKAAAEEENKNIKEYIPEFTPERKALAKPLDKKGYYVCLNEKRMDEEKDGNILAFFENSEEAKALCDEKKVYGYRVADEKGNVVYAPYTLLQCDLLREGKYITDFVRTNGFLYGDAPLNPGIDCEAKRVSCDRLVCWALFRLGFIRQPYAQGVVVSAFPDWCVKNGFREIFDYEALEPGDVMLVRPHHLGYPQHAFMFAGYCEKPENEPNFPACVADPLAPAGEPVPENLFSYRYDCGSDARIQNVQPSRERLFPGAYVPVHIYRPVATKENCVNYERYN